MWHQADILTKSTVSVSANNELSAFINVFFTIFRSERNTLKDVIVKKGKNYYKNIEQKKHHISFFFFGLYYKGDSA